MAENIILGIDPGTTLMGYGVLKVTNGTPEVVTLGVINLKNMTDHFTKLQHIFNRVTGLVKEYLPDELAIEAPFYGKNVQSMLKLGRAQGVAIAAALAFSIPVFEYAPRKIKMAITGQGSASKEQVAALLKNILKLKEIPDNLDATDVAVMLSLMKVSRMAYKRKHDSVLDFASYANFALQFETEGE